MGILNRQEQRAIWRDCCLKHFLQLYLVKNAALELVWKKQLFHVQSMIIVRLKNGLHIMTVIVLSLFQLCTIPNKEVCKQAVGALLNLALNFKVKARIGFLGGIPVLLGK